VEWIWGVVLMEVDIKKELQNLDRNNFMAVVNLVDKIVSDLSGLLIYVGDETMLEATKDYMIDLINPDLLDFDTTLKDSI
jgi:hypothetical protein